MDADTSYAAEAGAKRYLVIINGITNVSHYKMLRDKISGTKDYNSYVKVLEIGQVVSLPGREY